MKDKKRISKIITDRILKNGAQFRAEDNISEFIEGHERQELILEIEEQIETLLQSLIIDTKNDEHTKDTSSRIAKMLICEVMHGRYYPMPRIKSFNNLKKDNEIIMLGPLSLKSMCSHHFVPVIGKVYLGIISSHNIWGISKFSRICEWFLRRPHIQEHATDELANLIHKLLQPQGVFVYMTAQHFCMSWRGVEEDGFEMTTIAKTGLFALPENEQRFYKLLALRQK